MRVLFFLFVVLPILEIWLLIRVGGWIGGLPTIGLVLLTAFVGAALLRQQGVATIAQAQQKMQQGTIPVEEMVAGICLAVGGALLLTPGFVTDTIGFCCLIPGLRKVVLGWAVEYIRKNGNFHVSSHHMGGQEGGSNTYEGEYRREDDSDQPKIK